MAGDQQTVGRREDARPRCLAARRLTASLLFALLPATAFAAPDTIGLGTGRSGAVTLAASGVVNTYAPITQPVAAGATSVVIDPTLAQGAPEGFAAGDLILLWHTMGWTAPVVSGDQTPVDLSANPAAGPAGLWELARVSAVNPGASPDAQTLVLSAPTTHPYAAGLSQVVRVPEYTDFTVAAAVYLRPAQFNGRCGGIVALLATGTVTLAATDSIIDAGSAGFVGGALTNVTPYATDCTALDGNPSSGFSMKGSSFDPRDTLARNQLGGYGNRLSGGGGGNCTNSGGGGGGGASAAVGGKGANTWSLNLPYGGKGGAGIYGDVRERLLLGGGGGAGEENNETGSVGGRGGGVVFLRAAALAGTGRIWAHGGDALAATTDGGGGGGGGGTVAVRLSGSGSCTRINVRGGGGAAASDSHGPGGGGGAGTIFFQSSATACDLVAPGGAAATNASHSSTAGGAGSIVQPGAGYCGPNVPACPAALPVCGSDGTCRACQTDAECPGAVCDRTSGTCVECTADAHCPQAAKPVCDVDSLQCRACAASSECAARLGKVCETEGARAGECVACTTAEAEACVAPSPWCLSPNDLCVGCLNDAHCLPAAPVCDAQSHSCRSCRVETECPTGHCAEREGIAGTCVECLGDEHCGDQLRCEVATGTCVGCLTSEDCVDPTHPVCRSGACGACAVNADCPSETPACWPSGQCLQCSASLLSSCEDGQRCDVLGHCVDCLIDSDCGAADSARICEAGACIDGCRGPGLGNGCPAGERCSSAGPAPGVCAPSPDAGVPLDAGGEEPVDGGFEPGFGAYDLGGCGCTTSTGPGLGALLLLAGLLRRRRR